MDAKKKKKLSMGAVLGEMLTSNFDKLRKTSYRNTLSGHLSRQISFRSTGSTSTRGGDDNRDEVIDEDIMDTLSSAATAALASRTESLSWKANPSYGTSVRNNEGLATPRQRKSLNGNSTITFDPFQNSVLLDNNIDSDLLLYRDNLTSSRSKGSSVSRRSSDVMPVERRRSDEDDFKGRRASDTSLRIGGVGERESAKSSSSSFRRFSQASSMKSAEDDEGRETEIDEMPDMKTFSTPNVSLMSLPIDGSSQAANLTFYEMKGRKPGRRVTTINKQFLDKEEPYFVENKAPIMDKTNNIFLKASLQLLDEKSKLTNVFRSALGSIDAILAACNDEKKSKILDLSAKQEESIKALKSWAHRYISVSGETITPLPPGIICGYLLKLGGGSLKWQKRYVVLDPPNLLYFENGDMTELKGLLRLDGCKIKQLPKANQFEILLKPELRGKWEKKNYRFQAESEQEYKFWLLAINKASQLAPNIIKIMDVRTSVQNATDREGLLKIMNDLSMNSLILPINFIHEYRHSVINNENLSILQQAAKRAADLVNVSKSAVNSMSQVDKDMQRDSISIDGVTYTSETGDYIVEALTQKILKTFADTLGVKSELLPPMSHAHAIAYARRVLLSSARTVSGGDAYDGLRILFQTDLTVITPEDSMSSPVVIQIIPANKETKKRDAYVSTTSTADLEIALDGSDKSLEGFESIMKWPKIKTLVSSHYKLCNLDPVDDDDAVWGKIEACFCKSFKWVSSSPPDDGFVSVKVYNIRKV